MFVCFVFPKLAILHFCFSGHFEFAMVLYFGVVVVVLVVEVFVVRTFGVGVVFVLRLPVHFRLMPGVVSG